MRTFSSAADLATAVAMFELRAWARARLLAEGEIQTVSGAIDPLTAAIDRSGLCIHEALWLMSETFRKCSP